MKFFTEQWYYSGCPRVPEYEAYAKSIAEKLPDFGAEVPVDLKHLEQVQEVSYQSGDANTIWRSVRPLPESPQWFDQVWRDMKEREETL